MFKVKSDLSITCTDALKSHNKHFKQLCLYRGEQTVWYGNVSETLSVNETLVFLEDSVENMYAERITLIKKLKHFEEEYRIILQMRETAVDTDHYTDILISKQERVLSRLYDDYTDAIDDIASYDPGYHNDSQEKWSMYCDDDYFQDVIKIVDTFVDTLKLSTSKLKKLKNLKNQLTEYDCDIKDAVKVVKELKKAKKDYTYKVNDNNAVHVDESRRGKGYINLKVQDTVCLYTKGDVIRSLSVIKKVQDVYKEKIKENDVYLTNYCYSKLYVMTMGDIENWDGDTHFDFDKRYPMMHHNIMTFHLRSIRIYELHKQFNEWRYKTPLNISYIPLNEFTFEKQFKAKLLMKRNPNIEYMKLNFMGKDIEISEEKYNKIIEIIGEDNV